MASGAQKIMVLGGDGIGPEVTAEAVRVLRAVERRFGLTLEIREALAGQAAVDVEGVAITEETMELCRASDAILFGAVGGAAASRPDVKDQPMYALFRLRKDLELFANLRPVRPLPALAGASSIKRAVLRGVDLLVVRELTGGIYYGQPSAITEGPGGGARRRSIRWPTPRRRSSGFCATPSHWRVAAAGNSPRWIRRMC